MKKKGKLKTILIIIVVLIVIGVACGGKGNDTSDIETSTEPETEAVTEETPEEEATNTDSGDRPETDISPEFKNTMDSYEAFFDEYVEFMNKFDENSSDPEILMEYANLMSKEADMFQKLEDMDESEMTTAEAAYYVEVTARIEAKLATVQ